MGKEFRTSAAFRGQLGALTAKEPSKIIVNDMDLARWNLDYIELVRLAK